MAQVGVEVVVRIMDLCSQPFLLDYLFVDSSSVRLYVGSLHFNLTEDDIRQVFEPFGELEYVDLHRDPGTNRSKGYAFVQYKKGEDAKMALEQMEGFELAGRTVWSYSRPSALYLTSIILAPRQHCPRKG